MVAMDCVWIKPPEAPRVIWGRVAKAGFKTLLTIGVLHPQAPWLLMIETNCVWIKPLAPPRPYTQQIYSIFRAATAVKSDSYFDRRRRGCSSSSRTTSG